MPKNGISPVLYSPALRPQRRRVMRRLTIWQATAIALEAGTAMAVAVLIGVIVGKNLDDRLGTSFFAILGSLIGLASGVYSFAKVARYMTPHGEE